MLSIANQIDFNFHIVCGRICDILLQVIGYYMKEFHMARTVITKVTDDLTGDIINGRVVERSIVIDGVPYLLELSEDSSRQLDEDLEPWTEAGKRAAAQRKSNARRTSEASNVRTWANENGWSLGSRGRIPFEVIEAYRAAH